MAVTDCAVEASGLMFVQLQAWLHLPCHVSWLLIWSIALIIMTSRVKLRCVGPAVGSFQSPTAGDAAGDLSRCTEMSAVTHEISHAVVRYML